MNEPHWNHRIIRRTDKNGYDWFEVREVYYDRKGKIDSWTVEPIRLYDESLADLKETLGWILNALDTPVLVEIIDEKGKNVLVELKEE